VTGVDELVWVTLIADVNTPAEFTQYNGRIIGLPPGVPLPQLGVLVGVPGRRRPGTVTTWEWVMTGPVDKVAQAVDAIPGGGGWVVLAARDVWVSTAHALLNLGVPGAALQNGLAQLYSAAVTNDRAASP